MKLKLSRAINGGVIICCKEVRKGRTVIWPKDVPELRAESPNFAKAEEKLLEDIWRRCDLDEPVAIRYESQPRPNRKEREQIVEISPDETIDAYDPSRYFEGGFCPTCQSGLGRRNMEVLELSRRPKDALGGVSVRFQPFFKCGMRVGLKVLHESICDLLGKRSGSLFEFRTVTANGKNVPNFREVIPLRIVPCEIPRTQVSRPGGKCEQCGAEFIYRAARDLFIGRVEGNWIRKSGAAGGESFSMPMLFLTSGVWSSIRKLKVSKSLLSFAVTALKKDQILDKPVFERIRPFKL